MEAQGRTERDRRGLADESGTERRRDDFLAEDRSPSPLDPALVRQPAPEGGLSDAELDELEREAIEDIALVAQRHLNRLPSRSTKRRLLLRIAGLRLGLDQRAAPSPGGEPAA